MTDEELGHALMKAHRAAECGDYYCGCWDQDHNDPGHKYFHGDAWPHMTKFLAALREQGFKIVRADR